MSLIGCNYWSCQGGGCLYTCCVGECYPLKSGVLLFQTDSVLTVHTHLCAFVHEEGECSAAIQKLS